MKHCPACNRDLPETEYYRSTRGGYRNKCKTCWKKQNAVRHRHQDNKSWWYKHGGKPMSDNTDCASYLGIHITESMLINVFSDVKRMPNNSRGFDFICKNGLKIDAKSSVRFDRKQHGRWCFSINRNKQADYFACVGFDSRECLNPIHLWLIPGQRVNMLKNLVICESKIERWEEYEKTSKLVGGA